MRDSFWTRWPDPDDGPLWVGVHVAGRAGVSAIVGLEIFTEPPFQARTDPGPAADVLGEAAPWPPTALRASDVGSVTIGDLVDRYLAQERSGVDLAGTGRRGRPRTYGPHHWQRVAGCYRQAVEEGRAPVVAIAERWKISRSGADKWVARARREGALAPTSKGDPDLGGEPGERA